jgi:hypothetical protein
MVQKNELTTQRIDASSLGKRVMIGAAIPLVLMTIFLLQVDQPDPDWGKFWMIRPIVLITLAGAMGAVFHYFLDPRRYEAAWERIVASVLRVVVYVIGVYAGFVLGLDGTLWN